MDRSSYCFIFLVGTIFSSIEQMFPIIVWTGAGHWRLGDAVEQVLSLGTSAHDLRLARSHQPMDAKKSPADTYPVPQPTSSPRTPVYLKPPTCHPHEIILVIPSGVLHEPTNLTRLCCSLFPLPLSLGRGPLWPRGHLGWPLRHSVCSTRLCSTQTLPRPRPSLSPFEDSHA